MVDLLICSIVQLREQATFQPRGQQRDNDGAALVDVHHREMLTLLLTRCGISAVCSFPICASFQLPLITVHSPLHIPLCHSPNSLCFPQHVWGSAQALRYTCCETPSWVTFSISINPTWRWIFTQQAYPKACYTNQRKILEKVNI